MAEGDQADISEEVNPPVPVHSQPPLTHAPPPPTPAGILQVYSGAPPTHLPPPTSLGAPLPQAPLTSSTSDDQARITALEGTVNQMAANMAELLALLRGLNRASSSSTPPPGQGPTVDPAPGIPSTQAPENMDAPAPPTLHTSMAQPFTSPIHHHRPPRPSLFHRRHSSLQIKSYPRHRLFLCWPRLQPIQSLRRWFSRPQLIPGIAAAPEVQDLGVQDLRGNDRSTPLPPPLSGKDAVVLGYWEYEEFVIHSFQDSLSGSALDWFMSLKAEDIPTWEDLSRKFIDQYRYCVEAPPTLLDLSTKEMARGQRRPKQYSVDLKTTPTAAPTYLSPPPQHQPQSIYYSTPPALPTMTSQSYDHYAPASAQPPQPRPPVSRAPPPSQQNPILQGPQVGTSQHRPRKQYTPLPAPLSHIYRQLLAGDQIRPISPGPNFDPSIQDQSKRCEYHQGAPGHTLDNCWRLRDEIQRRIDSNRLTFNAVRPLNVQDNPLSDHRPNLGPSINMISACASGRDEDTRDDPFPFVIHYTPEEPTVGFAEYVASSALFVVDIPAREPYTDSKQLSVMGVTRSGRVYENPAIRDEVKAPATESGTAPESSPFPSKKVTEEEAEAFMKIVKALLRVLTTAQVPKETPPDRIEETVGSIFSNTILFSDDELPSEGCSHSRALHIVCKCNNYIIGRVMIDNGFALNVCPVTTLKQMNVDLNRVRPSKTAVRAFDGSRREVNGEIDLLIDVGPCSFSITFQVLDIPNAFSLLLGRPWIHSAGAVPSSLHQRLKFIVEEKLITVKGEEDYAIYKETAVPYISVGDDENLQFHSFETISVIRDYGESGPSRVDPMIGKGSAALSKSKSTNTGGDSAFALPVMKSSRPAGATTFIALPYTTGGSTGALFFPGPSHTIGGTLDGPSSDSDDTPAASSTVYAVIKKLPSGVHIRLAQENEELDNWTSVPRYSAVIVDVLHLNPNPRHFDSNPFQEHLGEPQPVYFGEGLPEDSQMPEIEESLRRLEDHQITSVEPTEEINVGTEEEPRTLKIETALNPTQRTRMINFLKEYQEVFAWSYADMPGLDPSIVEYFLPLDTEKFPPKRQQLRRQRASLLFRIREEVVKQINAGFLEVCNYSEWVANIVPVEKKDGRVRVCVDYRDLNKASPKDNFPLPHIDVLVYNTARHAQFSFMDGFSGYNQIRMLLGFVVSEQGIEVDPDKVKAIKELPPPSTVREVRGFLGRLNYIARFIANLTDKCQPLFRLLRKNAAMEWDHECQKAFDTIKAYLIRPPILAPPVPNRPLILYLTVRRQSLGCMLGQEDESKRTERAIYYLSKKFTEGESNYPEIVKMCCALVWVIPSSMRNIAKWRCQLTEYDIEYVPRTSVKGQAIADHLAEFPIDDYTPINTDFPDEGILQVDEEKEEPTWKMYFDGAVNSVGSGVGAVLISPDGRHYPVAAKVDFSCTNNVAEYEACIIGLQAANQFADALATLASMASILEGNIIEPLEIEVAKSPAHCNAIGASEAKPWYEDIRNFLQTSQYPPFADRRDRKTLRRLAMHYFLSCEILYRRSFDSTLLRYIDEHESRCLMEEVHGGNCGPHMNGLMLAKKIMRLGYY
ncbi:hypothetical protein CRG98_012801 [Punica granatum]|uniref:Uncharacterized protein n=1 Tax=Punica granatum TaxID=22663 RepID=A0A2I0KE56_PUNGR|nr:hypothetical protein CRG98_012801 [Punica granatum]